MVYEDVCFWDWMFIALSVTYNSVIRYLAEYMRLCTLHIVGRFIYE